MEWVNITAKTLPEAIDLALDNLGVDESEAEIEVLEEPKQGLFGRTRGTARVRARVKPKASRPKVERGRGRKRRSDSDSGSGSKRSGRSSKDTGRDESKDNGSERSSRERDDRSDAAAGTETSSTDEVRADDDRSADSNGGEDRKKRSGGGRKRSSGDRPGDSNSQEATMEEVSEHLQGFLVGLTEAFGYDGDVAVDGDDDEVVVSVDGRHGLMIGPRGRTLEAIQELARVSAQRTTPSSARIKVDVGGYRELRREALEAFAAEAAGAAVEDGVERLLEPMSSADRKIVHDALSDNGGVETRSAGNEPYRRVVVVPVNVDEANDDDDGDEVDVDQVDDVENDAEEAGSAGAEADDDTEESGADVEKVG